MLIASRIDGERKLHSGGSAAAGANAGEVADGEQGEDAQDHPGVGVRREEVEEEADQADQQDTEQQGGANAGDRARS